MNLNWSRFHEGQIAKRAIIVAPLGGNQPCWLRTALRAALPRVELSTLTDPLTHLRQEAVVAQDQYVLAR